MGIRRRTNNAQIHVVPETTEGTYVAPSGTTGLILGTVGDAAQVLEGSNHRPTVMSPHLIPNHEVTGGVIASIPFSFWLHGSGDAGDITPDFENILRAAGFAVTNTPLTSDVYWLSGAWDGVGGNPAVSYSCTILEDGAAYALKNACCSAFSITATAGEAIKCDATMMGQYVALADDALEAVTGYNNSVPPSFMAPSFSTNFASVYAPVGLDSFSIDLGLQAAALTDVLDPTGISAARVNGMDPSGTFTMEARLLAAVPAGDPLANMIAKWRNQATDNTLRGTITTGSMGGSAGHKVKIDINKAMLRAPELVNADGFRKYNVPYSVGIDAGVVPAAGQTITITFD